MGRVKGLRPEDTRRRVVDGAADVFARQGYEGARVTDIAAAAGLSNGAMYNHFASKADLLAAVVQTHACNQLWDWVDADGSTGVLDVIREYGEQLGSGDQPGAGLLVEAVAAARRDPEVLSILTSEVRSREDLLAQALAAAQAGGEVDDTLDPATVARFMFMVVLGSALAHEAGLPRVPPNAWTSLMSRVIAALQREESP